MLRCRINVIIAEKEMRGDRVERGKIAERVGISPQYFSQIASGKAKSPNPEILWKIARELGVEVGELYLLEE